MTSFGPLVDAATTATVLGAQDLVICDCTFNLADPEAGRVAFRAAHLPAARYLHLDEDLSAPGRASGGRHPLPSRSKMVELFTSLGIGHDTRVIAYDQGPGVIASRLWWMLGHMGGTSRGGRARWRHGSLEGRRLPGRDRRRSAGT